MITSRRESEYLGRPELNHPLLILVEVLARDGFVAFGHGVEKVLLGDGKVQLVLVQVAYLARLQAGNFAAHAHHACVAAHVGDVRAGITSETASYVLELHIFGELDFSEIDLELEMENDKNERVILISELSDLI